jgi:hypothetical protein
MTKKYFEALAAILAKHREGVGNITWPRLIGDIADLCGKEPSFQRLKFIARCRWPEGHPSLRGKTDAHVR